MTADWAVARGGLINLDHPEAKAESLKDDVEPIQSYAHVVRPPQKGRFLVDTGVEKALRDDPTNAALRGSVASAMHVERLVVRRDTASIWVPGHTAGSTAYLARTPEGAVLFTGDTCHTAWGWEHSVEPGDFTRNRRRTPRA